MPLLAEEKVAPPAAAGRRFLLVTFVTVVLSLVLAVASRAVVAQGWLPEEASGTGVGATRDFITLRQGSDSWMPMIRAVEIHAAGKPIYDTLFFAERVKFQYPLTSLLPVMVMREAGLTGDGFPVVARVASWLAVWATIAVSIAIHFRVRRSVRTADAHLTTEDRWLIGLALGFAGLNFYPLMKSFALGQIQTFLTLLFAVACYCWVRGKERAAGALIGLMILVKPHYAVIGLWFALRRRFGALWTAFAVGVGGLAAATAVFGWKEQIKYLDVIREASRGESYFANMSFNGIVNRLLRNGPNLSFDAGSFAPYHPAVLVVTLLSAVVLMGAAFVLPRTARGGPADFCAVAVAVTIASPIAWDHHYAILFPAFALLLAAFAGGGKFVQIALVYGVVANAWTVFNVFAEIPVLNLLQSVSLGGVLLCLSLLWRLQNDRGTQASPGLSLRFGNMKLPSFEGQRANWARRA